MSILTIQELNYALPDKVLYEEGELTLNRGEHMGLIGKNGAGKSTLIKILIGEVLPDTGQITWQNRIKRGYLEQYLDVAEEQPIRTFLKTAFHDLYAMESQIQDYYAAYSQDGEEAWLMKAGGLQERLEQAGFYELDQRIEKLANGLGLDAIGMEKELNALSGGQRSKVFLAQLLLAEPDVLLLDEPTNYLDDSHVQWLADFLNEFAGSFIVISHDYHFLDQITNCVCDIEFGRLEKYPGNLTKALALKKIANDNYLREYAAQQTQISKLEAYIRKYKAGSRSTQAKSREKQLDKLERLQAPERHHQALFTFPSLAQTSGDLLETSELTIGYQHVLLPALDLLLRKGEKIALRGFNGIGKSTLLKTLIGEIPPLGGAIAWSDEAVFNYFSQELAWHNQQMTPFDVLRDAYPTLTDKEIRGHLARCGIHADNVNKALKFLSGGEQTKVKLCLMTLVKSNVLILDEPTNHLDSATKRALKEALVRYEGTLIMVSHEADFYETIVERSLDLGE